MFRKRRLGMVPVVGPRDRDSRQREVEIEIEIYFSNKEILNGKVNNRCSVIGASAELPTERVSRHAELRHRMDAVAQTKYKPR